MYLTQSGELKSLYIDDDNGDYYCTIDASDVAMVDFVNSFIMGMTEIVIWIWIDLQI